MSTIFRGSACGGSWESPLTASLRAHSQHGGFTRGRVCERFRRRKWSGKQTTGWNGTLTGIESYLSFRSFGELPARLTSLFFKTTGNKNRFTSETEPHLGRRTGSVWLFVSHWNLSRPQTDLTLTNRTRTGSTRLMGPNVIRTRAPRCRHELNSNVCFEPALICWQDADWSALFTSSAYPHFRTTKAPE